MIKLNEKDFNELFESLMNDNLSFFFDKIVYKPKLLEKKDKGVANFFSFTRNNKFKQYHDFSEINRSSGDVCFLQGKSLRVLTIGYPYRAKYVLVNLSFSFTSILSIPGLVRRLIVSAKRLNSKIYFLGINKIKNDKNKNQYWLVLKNTTAMVPTQFTLSENIGIKEFIAFLNLNVGDYVIARFFEKLPNLYRKEGDLDIIVSDEKWELVRDFLFQNPGNILIDMYGITKPSNGVMLPYYPPHLSAKMIKESKIGPAGAKVPNNYDYLNSFIYHCVYHKGFTSGIKSKNIKSDNKLTPDNNYHKKVIELFKLNNIPHGDITLENLDEYMSKVGWRPQSDTLSFISLINPWLNFNLKNEILKNEIGLSVIILKKKFKVENIKKLKKILDSKNFLIIKDFELEGKNLKNAINILRGGNWLSEVNGDTNFLPWYFIIVKDNTSTFKILGKLNIKTNSIRILKNQLRNKFDVDKTSLIHATDNTTQAIEYIELIDSDFNLDELKSIESRINLHDILKGFFIIPKYFVHRVKRKGKDVLANLFKFLLKL